MPQWGNKVWTPWSTSAACGQEMHCTSYQHVNLVVDHQVCFRLQREECCQNVILSLHKTPTPMMLMPAALGYAKW